MFTLENLWNLKRYFASSHFFAERLHAFNKFHSLRAFSLNSMFSGFIRIDTFTSLISLRRYGGLGWPILCSGYWVILKFCFYRRWTDKEGFWACLSYVQRLL